MAAADRDSVSEGCYLVLPVKHGSKRARSGRGGGRRAEGRQRSAPLEYLEPLSTWGGFQRLFSVNENLQCLEHRRRACELMIEELERRVQEVLLETNQRALSNLITFLDRCNEPLGSAIARTSSPYKEIPTGLVFAGVNIPDHDVLFRQIAEKIRDETSHRPAVLQSKDCSSLSIMLKSMISQLIGTVAERDVHDSEDWEEYTGSYKGKGCAAAPYDMQILERWYLNQPYGSSTLSEGTDSRRKSGNFVVVIQDFECFPSYILEDFLTICSIYIDRLPITLVLGIATSSEALHQALPQSALALLRTEKFLLSTAERGVDALIDEFLIRRTAGIKLSYGTLRLILDNFLMHNKSLAGVVRCIKYAIMDFFYANPVSILGCANENEMHSIKQLLTPDHLEYLRMQKSFRSFIDQLVETDPDDARLLITSNEQLVARLPSFLDNLRLYHSRFAAALDVLDKLQNGVSQAVNATSFRRTRRDLYEIALERPITESAYFMDLMKLLSKLDLASFYTVTKACQVALSNSFNASGGGIFGDSADDYLATLEELLHATTLALEEDAVRRALPAGVPPTSPTNATLDAPVKPKTRLALRQSMAEKAIMEEKAAFERRTVLTNLREQAKEMWRQFFRLHMPHYTSIALSELSFYHNPRLLSRAFCAQPRAAIQFALGHPHHYLACPCCADDDDHLHPRLPDSSVAYKLYLESGRMINMYDWFVAFGMVLERCETRTRKERLEERPPKRRKSRKGKEGNAEEDGQEASDVEKFKQEVQARFITAVSELEFLGFIKPTNRKTDHFIRCTWGDL